MLKEDLLTPRDFERIEAIHGADTAHLAHLLQKACVYLEHPDVAEMKFAIRTANLSEPARRLLAKLKAEDQAARPEGLTE